MTEDFYNHLSDSKLMFIYDKLIEQFNTRTELHRQNPDMLPRELAKLPKRVKDAVFIRYDAEAMWKYPQTCEDMAHYAHFCMASELLKIQKEMARRYQIMIKSK